MITAWQTDTDCFAGSDETLPWWSVTKTVLAVACLRLAQQCKVDFHAQIEDRGYSLADLLAHRAGVASYTNWPAYHQTVADGKAPWSDDTVLAKAAAAGPDFEVGAGWSYSNTGYLMVRRIVESLHGAPIEKALRDLVFDPLDMRTARVARRVEDLVGCRWLDGAGYNPKWVYHGLVVGSAADACRFMQSVVAGGFLTSECLAHLTDRTDLGGPIEGRPWETAGYGLGAMIGTMQGVGQVIGHSGCGPQSVCALYSVPTATGFVTAAAFSEDAAEDTCEWQVQKILSAQSFS